MKFFKLNLFSLLATALVLVGAQAKADLNTVPYVDVDRYLGDWYQISHIPLWFEGGNCACARQRLTSTDTAGVIGVYNTCNTDDASGAPRSIKGTATDLDTKSNSKFNVNFEGVSFTGSYWIIGLDSHYRYAVVSDANSYSLYILAKKPTLSDELYQEAVALAAQQLDTSKLVMTDQKNCTYPE